MEIDRKIVEKRARESQQPTIQEAESKADSSTGRIYFKKGHDEYGSMTPQQWASKTRGELSSYKPRSREAYERETRKQTENIKKARAQEKAQTQELERKKEILTAQGREITEKNLSSIKIVSEQTLQKIKELKKQGKNPVLYNDQLYEDKSPLVNSLTINETMKEPIQRARIKQQWENKRQMENLNDYTRARMLRDFGEKKEKAEQEKRGNLNYAKDHPEEYFTPERKKSGQETINVTTQMDWRQFVKFEDKPPSKDELETSKRSQTLQEREQHQEDLRSAQSSMSWDWSNPIDSSRDFSETWGMLLDVKKENLQAPVKDMDSNAVLDMMELSKSSETISPMDYGSQVQTYETQIESSRTGWKAPAVTMAGTAFISVAKGAKNIFIDTPLHPLETIGNMIQMPFNAPEIIVQEGKAIMQDPIGAPIELATEIWAFGKLSKGVHRIIKPKITDIPVKGKSVKSLKTMRSDPKTGKLKTDQQIQIETELGKPKKRFFWEKSKVKPRKNLAVDLQRTTRSGFKGAEVLEGSSRAKGTLKLKGKKAKLTKKTITEQSPPQKIYDLDQAYYGKTSSGVKLRGKTGKLKDKVSFKRTIKTRKAHTRKIPDHVEGIYKDGEFLSITKKGKTINVKPSAKTKITKTGSKTYRSKKMASGDLILEEGMTGKFVKRKYTKQGDLSKAGGKPSTPRSPEFKIELDRKGRIKKITDLKETQTLESGKKVKLGRKPQSYGMDRLSEAIDKLYKDKSSSSGGKSGSMQKTASKGQEMSLTKPLKPIIDVISKDASLKGAFMPVMAFQGTEETPKGRSFLPKAKQEIISRESKILQPKEENMIIDILDEGQETETPPVIDNFTDQRSGELLGSIFGSKTRTEDVQDIFNAHEQITEPIIDIKSEQRQTQIPIPIQRFDQNTISDFEFKFDEITNLKEINLPPPEEKESDEFIDDEFLKGFDVFVKKKGKFKKLNVRGSLSKEEAMSMGAYDVEHSPSATFKLEESRDPLAMGNKAKIKDSIILDQFYERDGTFIERSKFRINTPEEVRGISHLGHIAKQTKSFIRDTQDKLPKMMKEFAVPSMTGNHKKNKGGISW